MSLDPAALADVARAIAGEEAAERGRPAGKALADQLDAAAVQLRKAIDRVERVVSNPRWPQNAPKVAPMTRNDLRESLDRMTSVASRIFTDSQKDPT